MKKLVEQRLERLNKIHRHVKSNHEATVLDLTAPPGWMSGADWAFVQLVKVELQNERLQADNRKKDARIKALEDGFRTIAGTDGSETDYPDDLWGRFWEVHRELGLNKKDD